MEIIINLLLVLVIFIFSLLLLILIIPISYNFSLGYQEKIYLAATVQGKGIYGLNLKLNQESEIKLLGFSFSIKPGKDRKTANKKPKIQEEKKASGAKNIKSLLSFSDVIKNGMGLILEIIYIIKPKILIIKGKIGLNEPHITGYLLGMLSLFVSTNKAFVMEIDPLWNEEYIEGELYLAGKFVLGIILIKILKFLVSKQTLKFLFSLRQKKLHKSCNLNS